MLLPSLFVSVSIDGEDDSSSVLDDRSHKNDAAGCCSWKAVTAGPMATAASIGAMIGCFITLLLCGMQKLRSDGSGYQEASWRVESLKFEKKRGSESEPGNREKRGGFLRSTFRLLVPFRRSSRHFVISDFCVSDRRIWC